MIGLQVISCVCRAGEPKGNYTVVMRNRIELAPLIKRRGQRISSMMAATTMYFDGARTASKVLKASPDTTGYAKNAGKRASNMSKL